ncbi:hypothetical protein [Microbacterium deminutum]|uniref:NUDIX hydrolase n=1 Tax=Microbacterium deminutum TaxID=344164 RepID=A0ABP5CRQ7_9MICO
MWGDIPTWLGLALAAAALVYAARQVSLAAKQREDSLTAQLATERSVEGSLLLQIDDRLNDFADVHVLLRPGGAWQAELGGPASAEEWSRVEGYLGALERVGVMVESGSLRPEIVAKLYGYRLRNIYANAQIREQKLVRRADGWQDLLRLIDVVEATGYSVRA